MLKKELELEEKVNLLERELKLLGEDGEKVRLDLEEAVDCPRLEIESVKMVLKELVPNFQEKFQLHQKYGLKRARSATVK